MSNVTTANKSKAKRDYPKNGYPSVTEALGVLRKIGLEFWFLYNTPEYCNAKSKAGREAGTDIHALIEKHINTEEMKIDTKYPNEVQFAMKSFFLFKKEHPEIKLKLSEIPGTSEKYGFNFTIDCTAEVVEETVISDWKTGECLKLNKKTGEMEDKGKPTIYDEHLMQVSAYVKGFNDLMGSNIQKACIVCFSKDTVAYNLKWMGPEEIDEYFNEGFLPALTVCKFQRRKAEEAKLILTGGI